MYLIELGEATAKRNLLSIGAGKRSEVLSATEAVARLRQVRASQGKLVLWVGSWVSVAEPTAIPSVDDIYGAVISALSRIPDSHRLAHNIRRAERELQPTSPLGLSIKSIPFEARIGEIAAHTGDFVPAFLQRLILGRCPNRNHKLIARLAAEWFDVVITTNFDECLEDTLTQWKQVVPDMRGFSQPGELSIIKLHGTIGEPDTVVATIRAIEERTARKRWTESLKRILSNRSVLFVGYGFHDDFDITPALLEAQKEGATFYWADRQPFLLRGTAARLRPIQIDHDLIHNNLLELLAEATQNRSATGHDLKEHAMEACIEVAQHSKIEVTQRLSALASVYYWAERGDRALQLFKELEKLDPTADHEHLLANAYMRARKFRSAGAIFDNLLNERLPIDETEKTFKWVEWNCGAGHCAGSGGRPYLASLYFDAAVQKLERASGGLDAFLTYVYDSSRLRSRVVYIADQMLRGHAENEIRLALLTYGKVAKGQHLDKAEQESHHLLRVCKDFEDVEDVSIPLYVEPLVWRNLARILLIRREVSTAAECCDRAISFAEAYGNPDIRITMLRTKAAAQPRLRFGLWSEMLRAVLDGRLSEFAKLAAAFVGLDGYGRLSGPIQFTFRNIAIATLDYAKILFSPRDKL